MKLERLSVLVIEDVKPMLNLITSVLDSLGVGNIFHSVGGERGLEIVKKENPDIILLDWEMPDFNGIEFTKELRTNTLYPNNAVPIIMITGYNVKERIGLARDSGVTEYLVKPFTAQQLTKRIEYVIKHPRDFIISQTYTGPDRRRRKDPNYQGPFRRADDKK